MSKQIEFNSHHRSFLLKVSACFAGLLLGSFMFAPKAAMQTGTGTAVSNVAVVTNNMVRGNYQPTPEPPKSTVRGRVFYADTGRAVKRVSLMFIPENVSGGPSQSPSGLTDNEGNFQMKAVQAGTYYAIVNAPGVYSPLAFFDFSVSRNRGGSEKEAFKKAFEGFEPIYVDGVTETFVQIPAKRGGAIGGRVIYDDGDAAIGVKVEILRKVEDKFMSSIPNFSSLSSMRMGGGVFQTDDRGVYRFAGLPPGEYIVKVSENVSHTETVERRYYDPFEGTLGGKSFLTIFYPDVPDTKSAQLITVAPGQEISEINLTLPSRNLYKIEGKVLARKDKSPVKAQINIRRKNQEEVFSIFDEIGGRQQAASTDENGNWKFKELPKGTYTLTIEPVNEDRNDESYQRYSNSNSMNSAPRSAPPKPKLAKQVYEITVEDKDLGEIIVELGYGAIVSGTVTTENNQEMPSGVIVAAHNVKSQEVDTSTTVYNGSENDMRRENSQPKKTNHDFKLEGVAEGKTEFKILINDDNFYVKSAMFNGTDLLANPIELKEGETLRNVQIVVAKGAGTLKGVVLDDAKTPVKNVQFNLVPTNAAKRKNLSFYRTAKTGENGEFELKAAPAEYAIIFDSEEYATKRGDEFDRWLDEAVKNAVKVTIKSNETEKVSLTAPK